MVTLLSQQLDCILLFFVLLFFIPVMLICVSVSADICASDTHSSQQNLTISTERRKKIQNSKGNTLAQTKAQCLHWLPGFSTYSCAWWFCSQFSMEQPEWKFESTNQPSPLLCWSLSEICVLMRIKFKHLTPPTRLPGLYFCHMSPSSPSCSTHKHTGFFMHSSENAQSQDRWWCQNELLNDH